MKLKQLDKQKHNLNHYLQLYSTITLDHKPQCKSQKYKISRRKYNTVFLCWGTRVAQLVKCLILYLSSGLDLRVPALGYMMGMKTILTN